MIKVVFAEDHDLFRDAIADMIDAFGEYKVICRARNGVELIDKIGEAGTPDIAVLDLAMPDMDGEETAVWLAKNYPETAVLILTSHDSEARLIPLVRTGIRGFIRKDRISKAGLRSALDDVRKKGYYLGGDAGVQLFKFVRGKQRDNNGESILSEKEIDFLKLCCSDLTYRNIAEEMGLTLRSIDGIRDALFEKLGVGSRVTLCMFAIRNGLVDVMKDHKP